LAIASPIPDEAPVTTACGKFDIALRGSTSAESRQASFEYILLYMKQILIEIDDRCAKDLERVAPARDRKRAEFIRLAIRRAIDLALDRATEVAYGEVPLEKGILAADLDGWDESNALAESARSMKKSAGRSAKKRAA
jgi:predicted transcriptional regulator